MNEEKDTGAVLTYDMVKEVFEKIERESFRDFQLVLPEWVHRSLKALDEDEKKLTLMHPKYRRQEILKRVIKARKNKKHKRYGDFGAYQTLWDKEY